MPEKPAKWYKRSFFYISFTQSKTALKTPNEAVFKEIFSKYQFNNYKFITEKTDLLKIINRKNKKTIATYSTTVVYHTAISYFFISRYGSIVYQERL